MAACYCGSEKPYEACCGAYIDGGQIAAKPEALMRSRYSAYVQAKIDYIAATMCAPASTGFDPLEARRWAESVEWQALHVIKARYDPRDSNRAMVEFKAYYCEHGIVRCLHERSTFVRKNGRWFYSGSCERNAVGYNVGSP